MKPNRIIILSVALLCATAYSQQNVQIVGGGDYTLRTPAAAQFGNANKYPRWDVAQTWTGAQTFNGSITFGATASHGATSAETFLSGATATFDAGSTLTVNGTLTGTHAQPSGTGDSPTFANLTLGSPLSGASGGTGVVNNGKTITLGGNLATSGAFGLTLTLTGSTNIALPTAGTLATLAGTETLLNKTLTSPILTTPTLGVASSTSESLTGTAGAGFVDFPAQSLDPSAPASNHIRLFANATNKFAWMGTSGFVRNFDGTLTASRNYTLQDTSGTVLLSTNVAGTTMSNIDSVTASSATNLTLAGGSSGSSLSLGQGVNGLVTVTGVPFSPSYPGLLDVRDSTALAAANGGGITFEAKYTTAGAYAILAGIQGAKLNATDSNTAGVLRFFTRENTQALAEAGRFTDTRNFLIGSTTDMTGTGNLWVNGGNIQAPLLVLASAGTNQNLHLRPNGTGVIRIDGGSGLRLESGLLDVQTNGTHQFSSPAGILKIVGTTSSANTTTGSLINGGGFGNAGAAFIGGNLTANGNFAVGTGVTADVGAKIWPSLNQTFSYGVHVAPTFATSVTSSGKSALLAMALAPGLNMSQGQTLYISSPTLGSTATVGTQTGVYVENQGTGGSGTISNAYGIDIAAQSGATTTNVGLRNAGTTQLTNSTDSAAGLNFTTGALQVSGGVSIAKTTTLGDTLYLSKHKADSIPVGVSTASFVTTDVGADYSLYGFGNAARAGLIRGFHNGGGTIRFLFGGQAASGSFGEYVRFSGVGATPDAALNTTSGALQVAGGAGVSGDVWVGGALNVATPGATSSLLLRGQSGQGSGISFYQGANSSPSASFFVSTSPATFLDYAGTLNWRSGVNGTTRMTLDAAGNLRLGTAADSNLAVRVDQNTWTIAKAQNASTGTAASAQVLADNGSYQTGIEMPSSTYTTSGPRVADRGYIFSNGAQGLTVHAINGSLRFWTNNTGTERAVIDVASGDATFNSALITCATSRSLPSWSTSGSSFRVAGATYTDTSSSGTVATATASTFSGPTFAASSATTYTDAATVYVAAPPSAGTNASITNPYSLLIAAGNTKFAGALRLGTTTFATFAPNAGEIILQNNTTDSPGVHFYTAANTNYGIDATSGSGFRIVKNLDEAGTVAASFTDTAASITGNLTVNGNGTHTLSGDTVMNGSRPVILRGSVGQVEVKGSSGGWDAVGLEFQGSLGTIGGALYGEGSSDGLNTMYWGYGSTPNSDKRVILSSTGTAIKGTTTNDNAAAGYVGEYVSSSIAIGSAVSLATATAKNVTSISLSAGDWDVNGVIDFALSGATCTGVIASSSGTANTLGAQDSYTQQILATTVLTDTQRQIVPTTRYNVSSTTIVYLVGQAAFSAGTMSAYGTIRARRIR